MYGHTSRDSAKIPQDQAEFWRQQAVYTVFILRLNLKPFQSEEKKTINHPSPKKKKQHKNKALQDTETDGACQRLLQQEKKEFIMEALKQV